MRPFDPDAFLAGRGQERKPFDPDAFLAERDSGVQGPRGSGSEAHPLTPPSLNPLTPAGGKRDRLSLGESLKLRYVAQTGKDYHSLPGILAHTTSFGIGGLMDRVGTKNLDEVAKGEVSTLIGKRPLDNLDGWAIRQRALEAGLLSDLQNYGDYADFLDKNKERFKDKAVYRKELAAFLQGMAQEEQRRRATVMREAQERLAASDTSWYNTLTRVGIDLTGFMLAFGRGAAPFIGTAASTRAVDLSTDKVTLDDKGDFVTAEGDSALKAAGKGAASAATEYALIRGAHKAMGGILGKAAETAWGRKIAESKAGNILRTVGWLSERTGTNHGPALAAVVMGQTLMDEGVGLGLRGSEKEGTTLGGRSYDAMARFFSEESLSELGWMMLLTSAAGGSFAAVRSQAANRNIDGHLRALGVEQRALNRYTPEQKWQVLEQVYGKMSPGKSREALDKFDRRCANLYDEITGQEGFDFGLMQKKVRPNFEVPTEAGPDGKPRVAWTQDTDTGRRSFTDPKSQIKVSENGDGTVTLFSPDGNVYNAKNGELAFSMARRVSQLNLMRGEARGNRLAYLEGLSKRLAGNERFEVFDTIHDLVARYPYLTQGTDVNLQTQSVRLKDGSLAVVLDNVKRPTEMLRIVLDPSVETLVRGLVDSPYQAPDFIKDVLDRLPGKTKHALARNAYVKGGVHGDRRGAAEDIGKFIFDTVFAGREANPTAYDSIASAVRSQVRKAKPDLQLNASDIEVLMSLVQEARKGDRGYVSYNAQEAPPAREWKAAEPPAPKPGPPKEAAPAPKAEAAPPIAKPPETTPKPPPPEPQHEPPTPPPVPETQAATEGGLDAILDAAKDAVTETDFHKRLFSQYPVEQIPLDKLEVNARELPQFKEDADPETGEVAGQELKGKVFPLASNPIVAYQRNDGRMLVVTGRHRVGLFRRNGLGHIDARVLKESDGWTLEEASTVDAISNIIDEKGTVKDYVQFFHRSGITRQEAEEQSILSRPKGRAAWSINEGAGEDLKSAIDWTGDEGGVRPEQAALIAEHAPVNGGEANAGIQRLALQKIIRGMPTREIAPWVQSMVRHAKAVKQERFDEGDIFAGTQWARGAVENEAEIEAREIAKRISEYERLRAILSQAIKKPKSLVLTSGQAAELGITDKADVEQLKTAWERANASATEWASPTLSRDKINEARIAGGLAPYGDDGKPVAVEKKAPPTDAAEGSPEASPAEPEAKPQGTVAQEPEPVPAPEGIPEEPPASPGANPQGTVAQEPEPEPAPEPLTLDGATQDETDAEKKRLADRKRIEDGVSRRITDNGTAGEMTHPQMDLGDANPNDLFGNAAVVRKGEVPPPVPGPPDAGAETGGLRGAMTGGTASPVRQAAEDMAGRIREGPLSRAEAAKIMARAFGGSEASGAFSSKDTTDVAELAVNLLIKGNPDFNPDVDGATARRTVGKLNGIMSRIPSQTTRTGEMEAMQQFSTPPPLAYIVNWAAGVSQGDAAFEPSAGIGGIAVFAHNAGAKVQLNELSPRRVEILKELGIADTVTQENAEQIHAIMEPRVKSGAFTRPSVIVMNPPFSASVTSGKKGDTKIGAKHIESALKLLADGGRLAAIVGNGMAIGRPAFSEWWGRIGKEYAVRANVGVSGKGYQKHGTAFDNQIVVIDKVRPGGQHKPVTGYVENVADLVGILKGVRDARQRGVAETQRDAAERDGGRGGEEIENRPDTATDNASGAPADAGVQLPVGTGRRPGVSGRDGPDADGLLHGDGRAVGEAEGAGGVSGEIRGNGGVPGEPDGRRHTGEQAGVRGSGGELSGGILPPPDSGLRLETAPRSGVRQTGAADTDSLFTPYRPAKAAIEGSQPHRTPLVEPTAMASVEQPEPTYTPQLPQKVVTQGKLSESQLEAVVYAGQSHNQILPNGERAGFFIGDGTGVGKGREIAGIIADNYEQGRRKALWVSKNFDLIGDAERDMADVGYPGRLISTDGKGADKLAGIKSGVAFVSYTSLAKDHDLSGVEGGTGRKPKERKGKKEADKSRFDKIVDWLGEGFDGVIAFDEVHLAGNAIDSGTGLGKKKASNAGMSVVELQRRLPNARIVYVSATGATEVSNLAYGDRLGIWGPGMPFPDKRDFFGKMHSGGMSALEIVSRDLKALGRYIARSLSWDGVKNRKAVHTLTDDQRRKYNETAKAWQELYGEADNIMAATEANKNGLATGKFRSAFFGAQQRFYNQLLTAMQMPTILADAKRQLADGKSVVFQIVNTNEAEQTRQLTKMAEEDTSLDDISVSPIEILKNAVEKIPTTLYEEIKNKAGNIVYAEVLDSGGNPVQDPEAVAKRAALLDRLGRMRLPDNPIDYIIDTFGVRDVAEVTGRGERMVRKPNKDGVVERQLEKGRTPAHRMNDVKEFNEGKRRVLVFSEAGGTGVSFHAGENFKNQQQRIHYLIQAGWKADSALQGFGRTHRSGEVNQPEYVLASTDISGHRRFISTIARRLNQLGSLTSGDRAAAGGGVFSAADNLENSYARDAVMRLFMDLKSGSVEGFTLKGVARKLGYTVTKNGQETSKLLNEDGSLNAKEVPDPPHFFNRILMMEIDEQNRLFDAFFSRMETRVGNAMEDGSFDPGLQTLKAEGIRQVSDDVVYEHPGTGAKTRLVEVDVDIRLTRTPWKEVAGRKGVTFFTNDRSGSIYAFEEGPAKTDVNGSVVERWRRTGTHSRDFVDKRGHSIHANYTKVKKPAARKIWEGQYESAPKVRTERQIYITGALLPIWDRTGIQEPRIYRVRPDGVSPFLGVRVPDGQEADTRKRLGAGKREVKRSGGNILSSVLKGGRYELANGWVIKRSKVNGEMRVEVVGIESNAAIHEFESYIGGFTEKIGWTTRTFIPTGTAAGEEAVARLVAKSPIVEDSAEGSGGPDAVREEAQGYGVPGQPHGKEYAGVPGRHTGGTGAFGAGSPGVLREGGVQPPPLDAGQPQRAAKRYALAKKIPAEGERLIARQLEFAFSNRDVFANAFGNMDSPEAWKRAFKAGEGTVSRILHDFFTEGTGHAFPHTFNGKPVYGLKIRGSRDVAALLMPLRNPYQECMKAIFLDGASRVLGAEVFSIGILDSSLLHPREAFKRGVRLGAKGVVFAHNHPSGDPSPSKEDSKVHDMLKAAGDILGIKVADHVITDGTSYYSFTEGMLPFDGEMPAWEAYEAGRTQAVRTPEESARLISVLRQGGGGCIHAIMLDTKCRVTAVSRIPFDPARMKDDAYVKGHILASVFRSAVTEPAASLILDLTSDKVAGWRAMEINTAAKGLGRTFRIPVIDTIYCHDGWARSMAGDYRRILPLDMKAAEVREGQGKYGSQTRRYMERNGIQPSNADEIIDGIATADKGAKAVESGEATYYILKEKTGQYDPINEEQPPKATQILKLFNGTLPPEEAQKLFDGENIVSRLILDNIQNGIPFDVRGKTVSGEEDAASILLPLRSPFFESSKAMYLDGKGEVLESKILTVGTLNKAQTDLAAVFADMPEGTKKIVFAHNRPSGDVEPTWQDGSVTEKLKALCEQNNVELADHIITNGKRFYSSDKGETLDVPDAKPAEWELFDPTEQAQPLNGESVKALADILRNGNTDNSHAIFLDNRLGIIAIQRIDDPINLREAVAGSFKAYGAAQVIIDAGGPLRHRPLTLEMEIVRPLSERGVRVADVLAGDTSLFRKYGDMMSDWGDVADQYAKNPPKEKPKDTSGAYTPEEGVYRGIHAEVDARREQRGLEKLVDGHKVSNWKAVTEARSELRENPLAGQLLASQMQTRAKALAPKDRAILLVEYTRTIVMRERAQMTATAAVDSGDIMTAENAQGEIAARDEMLDNIERALHNSGSEAGRSLQACKVALREDYSLAGMRRRLREAQDFAPLTKEQEKFVEDNFRKRDATEEQLNARIAELEEQNRLLKIAVLSKQAMNKMLMEKKAADPVKLIRRAKKALRNESLANSGYVDADFLTTFIMRMAKAYVAQGEKNAENLIRRITGDINTIVPELEITERKVAELFSRYGQVSFPKGDDISRTLADLKQQQLKMLAIEDVLNQIAPKRTGFQRGEPSAEVRELTRRLHRLMKEAGIHAHDRETQLKSALDALKTRLKNKIEDYGLAIQRGQRITEADRFGIVYDEEAATLKQKLEAAKATYDELFPPEPRTGEDILKRLTRIAGRTLEKWKERVERLKNKEPEPAKQKTTLTSDELEDIRIGIDYLKDYAQRLKDLANPQLSPEELEFRNYKRQLERAIATREERMMNNDFEPRKRKDREKIIFGNKDLFALWKQRQKVDREFRQRAEEARRKSQGVFEKAWNLAIRQNALLRSTMAAMDLTVGVIQGGLVLRRHPVIWAKSLKAAVVAICSERNAQTSHDAIIDSPDYYWIRKSKIRIRRLDEEGPLTRVEEALCRGLHRITNIDKWTKPIRMLDHAYKAANHGHVTFLNTARAAMLRSYADARGGYGKLDDGELRTIGKLINIFTGSADFDSGTVNRIIGNKDLNHLYFALPYAMSRFQVSAHTPFLAKNKHARRYAQSNYAALYATTVLAAALLTLLFAGLVRDDGDDRTTFQRAWDRLRTEFQLDPRASDFLKVPINDRGDRKANILPGLQNIITLLSRLFTWTYKDKYGDTHSYSDTAARRSALDDIARFNRGKLSPAASYAYDAFSGRTYDGKKFDPIKQSPGLLFGTPISINTAVSDWDTEHNVASSAVALMVMLGVGYTVTKPTDYNSAVADFNGWTRKLNDSTLTPAQRQGIYRKNPYMHRRDEIRRRVHDIRIKESLLLEYRQKGYGTRPLEDEIGILKQSVLDLIAGAK